MSQERRNGPSFTVGAGFGYSAHADSYQLARYSNGEFVDHQGFRFLPTRIKAGWIFAHKILASYSLLITPSNDTVSPYQSTYHGAAINYFPESLGHWILGIGFGKVKAKDRFSDLATGYLGELGLGLEADSHFLIEVNVMVGKMNNEIGAATRQRRLTTDVEFYFQATVNYFFYRN